MENLEIERKFLVKKEDVINNYKEFKCEKIEQGFIYLKPAIRVRKSNDKYFLTIKNKVDKKVCDINDLARTEYEIEIKKKAYNDLVKLCKGRIIKKDRYHIPYNKHIIELDIFKGELAGLIYAEVEFKNINEAKKFKAPNWFYKDVTGIEKYKNTYLSICKNIKKLLK